MSGEETRSKVATGLGALRSRWSDFDERGLNWSWRVSELVDQVMEEAFANAPKLIVLGVGSLGSRRLTPYSDLDLAIVYEGRMRSAEEQLLTNVLYGIWDAGFGLDHSTRTPRELQVAAADDPRVLVGMASARVVAGDAERWAEIHSKLAKRFAKSLSAILGKLEHDSLEREAKYGSAASLSEPDVKQSFGGTRDFAIAELIGWLDGSQKFDAQASGIHGLRVELHRAAGRSSDRLTIEAQNEVASAISSSREELMEAFGRSALAVEEFLESAYDRHLAPGRGRSGSHPARRRRVPLRLAAGASRADVLAELARIARSGCAPSTASIEEALCQATLPESAYPMGKAERYSFMELLEAGDLLWPIYRSMVVSGMATALFPWWARTILKPQNNPYHRYRLDRHLLETVQYASRERRRVSRPDLLLVSALLHDIGKGLNGDHSLAGSGLAIEIARLLGFDEDDSAVIARVVRNHLVLVDTAMRRNARDHKVIAAVAASIQSKAVLELLEVLTEADARATSPNSWTEWKARMVLELKNQVRRALSGEPLEIGLAGVAPEKLTELVEGCSGQVSVEQSEGRIVVALPDRPGILAQIAGVLLADHLEVMAVDALTVAGVAVESIVVAPLRHTEPNWHRIRSRLEEALGDPNLVPQLVGQAVNTYSNREKRRTVESRVVIEKRHVCLVEVRSADRLGLLYQLASHIAGHGLSIEAARVQTLGPDVVDTFYITDSEGGVPAEAVLDALYEGLSALLMV